jgi:hypothetical protein
VGCIPDLRAKVSAAQGGQTALDLGTLDFALAGPEHGYATTQLTAEEGVAIQNGDAVCSCCELPFSVLKGPRKCGMCAELACREDCIRSDLFGLTHVDGAGSLVCRKCIPAAKIHLDGAAAANPSLTKATREENLRLDAWAQGNLTDKELAREDLLMDLDVEHTPCAFCSRAFGVFRSPEPCTKCGAGVCDMGGCGGLALLPEIDAESPTFVCQSCLAGAKLPLAGGLGTTNLEAKVGGTPDVNADLGLGMVSGDPNAAFGLGVPALAGGGKLGLPSGKLGVPGLGGGSKLGLNGAAGKLGLPNGKLGLPSTGGNFLFFFQFHFF